MSLKTTLFRCAAFSICMLVSDVIVVYRGVASHLADVAHQSLRCGVNGVKDHKLCDSRASCDG